MKNRRLHGVTSVMFAGVASLLAGIATFQTSVWVGIGYLFACIVASTGVVYGFCAKCPCKAHCGHLFPGNAAMLFKRQPGPYTPIEMIGLIISLLLLVGLPQPSLWGRPAMLIAFWILMGIAGLQARTMVCRTCNNAYCPLNKAKGGLTIS